MPGGTLTADVLHVAGDADMQTLRPRGPIVLLNSPGAAGQVVTSQGVGKHPKWAPAAGGFLNPMTTLGDMIAYLSGGNPSRLPVGSSGQVLTVVAGVPAWAAGGGVTWPLAFSGDECFQPDSIVNSALCLHNNASATTGVTITGDTAANGPGIDTGSAVPLNVGLANANKINIGSASRGITTDLFGGSLHFINSGVQASLAQGASSFLIQAGAAGSPSTAIIFANFNGGTLCQMINSAPTGQLASNFIQVIGTPTGTDPVIASSTTDLQLHTTSAGSRYTILDLHVGGTTNPNHIQINNAQSGGDPQILAVGSVDPNIGMTLTTKGTGVVNFGYPTVGTAGASAGVFLPIRVNGTSYKLALLNP